LTFEALAKEVAKAEDLRFFLIYNLLMNFFVIFSIFFLWRVIDFLIIFFSQKFIPYLGFFPYKDLLLTYNLPSWLYSLANFDGLHYLNIAKNNYAQYEQAFFPLYPLLIKFFSPLFFKNYLLTGIVISHLSFFLGLLVIQKYLNLTISSKPQSKWSNYFWLIFFLLFFPTSFFFTSVYTEGLFFLLFALSLYFLEKKRYFLTSIFSFLLSTTRFIGIFFIIPIFFHLIKNFKLKIKNFNLMLIFSPFFGLGSYCFYLWKTTGDPLMFLTSQPAFGANRSTHLVFLPQVVWRYLKIFFTANHNFQYYISLFEFIIFFLVLTVLTFDLFKHFKFNKNFKLKILNYERLGLSLFSFTNLLLPTLTGTFSSIPRYALFSFSFFLYLAQVENKLIKIVIGVLFFIFHIIFLGLFTQGYFVS